MRYVMVPVPSEHVRDVMGWVLFRSHGYETGSGMRDKPKLRQAVAEADDLTRSLLSLVAGATAEGGRARLIDVAEQLDAEPDALLAALSEINEHALGDGRKLVRISNELAVGVDGKRGRLSFLEMRPEHARVVRAAVPPAVEEGQ